MASKDKIFLDTDVALDHLADRQPFAESPPASLATGVITPPAKSPFSRQAQVSNRVTCFTSAYERRTRKLRNAFPAGPAVRPSASRWRCWKMIWPGPENHFVQCRFRH